MARNYCGSVLIDSGGKVYEGQYTNKRKAVRELRHQAMEIMRNSRDDYQSASYTLSSKGKIIYSEDVPMRGLRRI